MGQKFLEKALISLKRAMGQAHPRYREKMIKNLIINEMVRGQAQRNWITEQLGYEVPLLLVISPTMRCPLRCYGCYSAEYARDSDLDYETFDRTLSEAKSLGSYFMVVSGGEPFIYDRIFDLLKKHDDIWFQVYTSGVTLNDKVVLKSSVSVSEGQRLVAIIPPPDSGVVEADPSVQVDVVLDDADFAVGQSDPKKDWPWIQPGPSDAWAGSHAHTFKITFDLPEVAAAYYRLVLDFVDTQGAEPPWLTVGINDTALKFKLPPGHGDESLGNPKVGKNYSLQQVFPAALLHAGKNTITLANDQGSWALYDDVRLESGAAAPTEAMRLHAEALPWLKRSGEGLPRVVKGTWWSWARATPGSPRHGPSRLPDDTSWWWSRAGSAGARTPATAAW